MLARVSSAVLLLILFSSLGVWAQEAFSLPEATLNVAFRGLADGVAVYVSTDITEDPSALLDGRSDPLTITLDGHTIVETLQTLRSDPWPNWAMALGAFGGQRIVLWGRSGVETVAVFVGDGEPSPVIVTTLSEQDRAALAEALRRVASGRDG